MAFGYHLDRASGHTLPRQVSFFVFKVNGRAPRRVSAMPARQQSHPQQRFTKNGGATSTSNITGEMNPAPTRDKQKQTDGTKTRKNCQTTGLPN